nr:methyltransferase domain-containing protein [Caenimonas aquaedulcis]
MEDAAHATDDRNDEHAASFDHYAAIAGRAFDRAIELGCGPFTNLRVLARHMSIGRCVLLDPLIASYPAHRHCTYRHGRVKVAPSGLERSLGTSLPGRALRRLVRTVRPAWLEQGIPVERKLAFPIEEMPACGAFDLVVMINVLEHCFDAPRIFEALLRISKPGAAFVFHDRLYDTGEVESESRHRFDAGHPLRIGTPVIMDFLARHFDALHQRVADVADHAHGIDLSGRGIYFIGVRR